MSQTRLISNARNALPDRCFSTVVLAAILLCGCDPGETSRVPTEAQDRAAETSHEFSCDSGESLRLRFLGPETVEVSVGDSIFVLQRTPTASGARYASAEAEFWNKGEEAMFVADGRRTSCTKLAQ